MSPVGQGFKILQVGRSLALDRCVDLLIELGGEAVLVEVETGRVPPHPEHETWRRARIGSFEVVAWDDRTAGMLSTWAAHADVVVYDAESVFSRDLDRTLVDRHCVRCALRSGGAGGRRAGAAPTELTAQAANGLMTITGFDDGPPTRAGFPVLTQVLALYAANAVMAAFYHRMLTAEAPQAIDLSMDDVATMLLAPFISRGKQGRDRLGNRHPVAAPWNAYPASDGEVVVCCGDDAQWQRLLGIVGRPDLRDCARTATVADRVREVDYVDAQLRPWFASRTVGEAVAALDTAGIPAAPVLSVPQLLVDPQYGGRAFQDRPAEHGRPASPRSIFGSPMDWSPAWVTAPTQPLQVVLERFGLPSMESQSMVAAGCFRAA
ncbi:MAG: CoA transferase [Lautropia sp.]